MNKYLPVATPPRRAGGERQYRKLLLYAHSTLHCHRSGQILQIDELADLYGYIRNVNIENSYVKF